VARWVLRRSQRAPTTKQLVDHARLVWVLSLAHRKGYGAGDEYLVAAERGYRFLVEHFFDRDRGGWYWTTDRAGTPVNDAKILYGQGFVVYGLVEYARASGSTDALQQALQLHAVVDEQLRDHEFGGWREHGTRDWSPLPSEDRRAGIDVIGRKSGDTHLHWMEALAELYAATADDGVRRSLVEVLDVSRRHLYPADPEQTHAYCCPDWTPDSSIANEWAHGHNVEFVWLMLGVERALGTEPSWTQFFDYVDYTLRNGFDHRRGGLYRSNIVDGSVNVTDKVFWVQAEMVAALTDAVAQRPEPRYVNALALLLAFVERHQADRADGVWLHTVTARGGRRVPRKSGPWKVGYHEVRALVKLVDTFAS
jgi:mannobiose 2-epimerase